MVFEGIRDIKGVLYKVKANKEKIRAKANESCEGMVKRGGGVEDVRVRVLDAVEGMVVIELLVNVCDSMGANIVNTIAEAMAPYLQELLG